MGLYKPFLQVGSVYRHSRKIVYWTTHNGDGKRLVLEDAEFMVLSQHQVRIPHISTHTVLVDGMKLFISIDCELAEHVFVKLT